MSKKYDHIFFDLDHTLWDFENNSRIALQQTLEKNKLINLLPSFEEFLTIYEGVNHQLWEDYRQKKVNKFSLTNQRFTLSLASFDVGRFDSMVLNDCYLDFMAEQTRLYPGAIELLDHLKKRGYQMHIITNGFKEVQQKKIHTSGLDQYISKVFISEVVQSPKPDRAIFEYAIKSCNARKSRSIMVGDNWDVDIMGALNFGIDQTMFMNNGQNKIPEEIGEPNKQNGNIPCIQQKRNKTFFINTLEELELIV